MIGFSRYKVQKLLKDTFKCVLFVLPQAAIRKELNEFKSTEMEVHASSKHLTRSVCVFCPLTDVLELFLDQQNHTPKDKLPGQK